MRRRGARRALATAALGAVLFPALAFVSYAGSPASAEPGLSPALATAGSATLGVTVTSVTPAVAVNNGPVALVASVRNLGANPVSGVTVTLRDGRTPLTTRAEVAAWAAGTTAVNGAVLAKGSVPSALAPGASAAVTLTVPHPGAGRGATWGAVPVSVEASAGSGATLARVRTFLGYQVEKQYVPISTAILLPLTLDTDPALSGTGATRGAAWTAATGPTSRLGRILSGADQTPASFIVDPTLTATPYVVSSAGPSATSTSATTSTTTSTTTTSGTDPSTLLRYATSTTELQARTDLAARITADPGGPAASQPVERLLVPIGDPDIAVDAVRDQVHAAVRATADIESAAGASGDGPALAWPAEGSWSNATESAVRAAFAPDLPIALVSSDSLVGGDQSAEPNERSASGLPLAVYDAPLSGLLGRATAGGGALALQQFVADSAALVGQRSGTARQLLIVGPRGLDPAPADLNTLLTGIGSGVPWITSVGARSIIVDGSATPSALPVAETAAKPPRRPASPLTPGAAARQDDAADTIEALAAVRGDGAAFATPWLQAGQQLLAAGWRTAPTGWQALNAAFTAAAKSGAAGVYVSPRQINFLADSGRIQITIINDLDVPIHDLALTLHPDNPRLRIESPTTSITIGAKSRTTRSFRATALAAGPVPITATLSAPDGTVIRTDAPVRISVTPTGDWMYWALGAIAGTILVVGIWRGVRRGRPAAAPTGEDAAQ